MSLRLHNLTPKLLACLGYVVRDDRYNLIRSVGELVDPIALLYASPVRTDHTGRRLADPGAGDALLYARQLRAEVAGLPTHTGLGGVVWDGTWILAILDHLMILLER